MSDNKILNANRKLDDDDLEGVSGGQILLNNAVYKGENANIHTQQLDEDTKGDVKLLGTKSVNQNSINRTAVSSGKPRNHTTIFGQNMENA